MFLTDGFKGRLLQAVGSLFPLSNTVSSSTCMFAASEAEIAERLQLAGSTQSVSSAAASSASAAASFSRRCSALNSYRYTASNTNGWSSRSSTDSASGSSTGITVRASALHRGRRTNRVRRGGGGEALEVECGCRALYSRMPSDGPHRSSRSARDRFSKSAPAYIIKYTT